MGLFVDAIAGLPRERHNGAGGGYRAANRAVGPSLGTEGSAGLTWPVPRSIPDGADAAERDHVYSQPTKGAQQSGES